jgi:surfeit locus 1 family protein
MPAGYAFHPRAWAFALAAAGCAAGIALGNWQSGRAADKRALASTLKPVTLRGEFLPQYTVLLDNKLYRGRPGYQVVQPLRLAGDRHVLVNRGWVPAAPTRAQLPAISTPPGEVSLHGLRLDHLPRALVPAAARPEGRVWQNATIDEFAAWSGLRFEAWVLEQHSALDDGLVRDWPRADDGIGKHESYALQWYALAVLSIVLFFILNISREKPGS